MTHVAAVDAAKEASRRPAHAARVTPSRCRTASHDPRGMKFSLVSRELNSPTRSRPSCRSAYDGLVAFGGCDRRCPAP